MSMAELSGADLNAPTAIDALRPRRGRVPARRGSLRYRSLMALTAAAMIAVTWEIIAARSGTFPGIAETVSFLAVEASGQYHDGSLRGSFWRPIGVSLLRYGVGAGIGVSAGLMLGLVMGASDRVRWILNDSVLVLLALPAVVWAFLGSLWFGLTDTAAIAAVALTSLPFVAVHTSRGVREVSPELKEMSTAFRVPRMRRARHLLFAGAAGSALSGVRLALVTGWNALLIVEWFGSTSGVGWRARFWYEALVYAGFAGWVVVFVVVIATIDAGLLRPAQRRAARWQTRPLLPTDADSAR